MASSSPAGTVPGISGGNIAFVTTAVDTTAPAPSNKTERPPLQHMNTSGHTMTPTPPGYADASDPEKGVLPAGSGSPILRKPPRSASGLMTEVDKLHGYREDVGGNGNGEKTAAKVDDFRLSLTAPDNTNVVLDGDMKKSKLGQLYAHLMTASIISRWLLFILPLLAIVWIPGILSLTVYPNAMVWGIRLIWWSIWLTVLWAGWWAALAAARIIPFIIRVTIGVIAVSTRRYIFWLHRLYRYIAFCGWTLALWITYQPLISIHRDPSIGQESARALDILARLLFGIFLCSGILLFEKFSIQYIAWKFHERSFTDRIAAQKASVKTLVTLYTNSEDLPSKSAPLTAEELFKNPSMFTQKRFLRQVSDSVRAATTTTATVFGNVASEIMGSSVLQPNSPQAIVKTTLESRSKMLRLAHRIFYSFKKKDSEYLVLEDVEKLFPNREEALAAFATFDRDENGDVTKEEMEVACLDIYSEQQSLENSTRNIGSAVKRLDNIFMALYVIIAAVVVAVVLDATLISLITGAGALVLGLSWLIGGTCQEILTGIIFLFVKHPFDVGDKVVINKETYLVKEIMLLSTVFLDSNSTQVQAPNNQLNTYFIQNFRRSPNMSETFTFDVDYRTTFSDLEKLREQMLAFVTAEKRDFQPAFDVSVQDFPEQKKMTLSADIKYKSNIQHAALRVKRRNKWICALKTIMTELKIYGPAGGPKPPEVNRYTKVPYDEIKRQEEEAKAKKEAGGPQESRRLGVGEEWNLGDKNAVLMGSDVFGNTSKDQTMSSPQRELSQTTGASTSTPQRTGPPQTTEVFEMKRTGA